MTQVQPEFIQFAHQLADMSGDVIRPYFRSKLTVALKSDESPVTKADHEAEAVMRSAIEKQYPGHGVLGEEGETLRGDADYLWVLDPIDGTKAFIAGVLFGTLISLVHRGTPILGIINQPILGERWVGADGQPTTFNHIPARTSGCTSLDEAVLSTTAPSLFYPDGYDGFERVRKQSRYVMYGYDCYGYGLVANGGLDIVIESMLKPHDFCALAPVVNGAGGSFTDWYGQPLTLTSNGNVIAAATPELGKAAQLLLAIA